MGYVYLIYDSEKCAYKIGVTRSKNSKRLKQLQVGNSTELTLIHMHETEYPFRLEAMLHNRYVNSRIMGEWYVLDDVDEFKNACAHLESCINALRDNPFFTKNLK